MIFVVRRAPSFSMVEKSQHFIGQEIIPVVKILKILLNFVLAIVQSQQFIGQIIRRITKHKHFIG